jgi:large subunit ribosomal protein L10
MNKEEKEAAVAELSERLQEAEAIFAIDYRGISVSGAADLRTRLAEADAAFKVVKNRLAKRAVTDAGADELDELLVGPTALTLIKGDAVIAAKAISGFAREHQVLEFKGGIMDGEPLNAEGFKAIARLPGLDVLRGQLVGVAASPITGLARGLGALMSGLAVALGQIAEQGLVEGESEPEEEVGTSDEVAEEAAEPAATSEPETADTGREAEDVGDGAVAEEAAEPAATSEPETADTGREAEDVGDGAVEPEPAGSEPEVEHSGDRDAEESED